MAEIQIGICVKNEDPKNLRRIKARTDIQKNETIWIEPLLGGHLTMPVPRLKESVLILYNDAEYDHVYYVPIPTEIPDEARQLKTGTVKDAFEVDLSNNVNLHMDGEGDTAQLQAGEVTIGADSSTEGIGMRDKIVAALTTLATTYYNAHIHNTGVGPSSPPIVPYVPPAADDIGSTKHKVEP